jgi:hypothetical protein
MVKTLRTQAESLYGLPQPVVNQFPTPVIARRAPTTSDLGYILGQIWVDKVGLNIYGLASNGGGIATWAIMGTVSSTFTTITATNFVTAAVATGTTLTGNTWSATGTNAAIDLNLTPKGAAGDVNITAGDLAIAGGNLEVPAGTVTGGTGVIATTGGVTATAGGVTATAGGVTATAGDITATAGNVIIGTAGSGLEIKEGANARMGQSVLAAGTIVVVNTSVTANTRSFISRETVGAGALGNLSVIMNPGVGFTINSDAATDISTINWLLIEKI